jgi:lysophospholipase L1-like esterase
MVTGPVKSIKLAVFSLLPVIVLFLAAELTVRHFRLDRPAYYAGGFGRIGEQDSILQADVDLGWSMKPGYRTERLPGKEAYVINSLGLRSPEVVRKLSNELRVLSLGESSTLGIGVEGEETYSMRLQGLLGHSLQPRPVTVVNAGVSAYSSFQSLKYLELRGFKLKPDVVLFYHELNDYLPSTIRDAREGEVEILQTDRQLYDSGLVRLGRWFLTHSALYRFASNSYAQRRISKLMVAPGPESRGVKNPQSEIGIPGGFNPVAFPFRVNEDGRKKRAAEIHPATIGRRVSDKERLDNLRDLVAVCRKRGVRVVIMHPSYKMTARHECLLTRFCADEHVPMLETYDILHPAGATPESMFVDAMHPSAAGHEALAEELHKFVLSVLD